MQEAAEQEGLTLLRAENSTGFKRVTLESRSVSKPFKATAWHGGRNKHLGMFATAEEAALVVARFLGPEGVAAALAADAAKALQPAPMTAAEVHAAASAEGLTLVRAENATGFKGVTRTAKHQQAVPSLPAARLEVSLPRRLLHRRGGGAHVRLLRARPRQRPRAVPANAQAPPPARGRADGERARLVPALPHGVQPAQRAQGAPVTL